MRNKTRIRQLKAIINDLLLFTEKEKYEPLIVEKIPKAIQPAQGNRKRKSKKLIENNFCIEHKNIIAECWHHIVPYSLGGTLTVPLCNECHSLIHHGKKNIWKNNRTLIKEGIEKARKAGKKWGRPKQRDDAQIIRLYEKGMSQREIAKHLKIGRTSVHRAMAPYLKSKLEDRIKAL